MTKEALKEILIFKKVVIVLNSEIRPKFHPKIEKNKWKKDTVERERKGWCLTKGIDTIPI